MNKYIVIGLLLIIGGKYSYDYLLSDQFEAYADRSKQPFTCYLENALGQMHIIMSTYESGYYRFSHTLARCPETPMAEEAMYGYARCLEGMARRPEAASVYEAYVQKYPGTKRARTASKAAEILRGT